MKLAVCLLARLQMDLCYCQCNSHLPTSSSATMEVIPGCYLIAEPLGHKWWLFETGTIILCGAKLLPLLCSKYYFTNSIHHCYYLEKCPPNWATQGAGIVENTSERFMASPVILFLLQKISIYFKDILGEARRKGKKNLTPMCSLPWENRSSCNLHICTYLISSPRHWSQGASSVPAQMGRVTQGTDLALLPVLHTTLILNHQHSSQHVCRLKVKLAKKDLRSDKLPGVCSHVHPLVLPLPFHLPPDLLSLNFGQILSLISRKRGGFIPFSLLPPHCSLWDCTTEMLDWGLCF